MYDAFIGVYRLGASKWFSLEIWSSFSVKVSHNFYGISWVTHGYHDSEEPCMVYEAKCTS